MYYNLDIKSIICAFIPGFKMALCGGVGTISEATDEVQEICNRVQKDVEDKLGVSFQEYKALSHKTQV